MFFLVFQYSIVSGSNTGEVAYNSDYGAPVCDASGAEECVAPSSLLKSRDGIGPGEPNSPNTIDGATDGAKNPGTYAVDEESVENITVEPEDGSVIELGDNVQVSIQYYCYSDQDVVNIVRTGNALDPSWGVLKTVNCQGKGGPYTLSTSFRLSNESKKHAVRGLVEFSGTTTTTEITSDYGDQDDIVLDFTSGGTDTTPPTSSDNWTASDFVNKSSATVELTATDSTSSVSNITYSLNEGSNTTVSGSSTTVTVSNEGNNSLEYFATDSAGNQESVNTEYVALDTSAPSSSDDYGISGWVSKPFMEVNLSTSDSYSGVDKFSYRKSANPFTTVSSSTATVNVTSEGNTTVEYNASDSAGNVEAVNTKYVALDTTPPSTSDDYGKTGPVSKSFMLVNLSSNDSTSGVDSISYSKGGSQFTTVSGTSATVNVTSEGKTTIEYYASDTAGNTEDTNSEDINLDTILPDIYFNSATPADGEIISRDWINVDASVSDSNLDSVVEEFDGSNSSFEEQSVTDFFTNHTGLSDGSYSFTAYANDTAGNTGTASRTVTVDTTPPSIDLDQPLDGESLSDDAVTFEATVTDPNNDVLDVVFYWDNGTKIGEDTGVSSGSTGSVTVSGVSYGQTFDWYANTSDGYQRTQSVSRNFSLSDPFPPVFQDLQDNVSDAVVRGGDVNISAEVRDSEIGLERAVLSTNETGFWSNVTGVSFRDGFEDGDYTSNPAWSDESTGGSVSTVSNSAEGSYGLQLSDEGRFSGYGNHPELVHSREMYVNETTKLSFYVQMDNLGSDPIATPDSRVKLGSEDGSYGLYINTYSARFDSDVGELSDIHSLNEGEYYKAEITFYPSNDTASNKLFDNTGDVVLDENLNYSGVETFQNITVNTNAGSGYSYDFNLDEFNFVNGEHGSPIYLDGKSGSWEPISFQWSNSSVSGDIGYRVWSKDSLGNWNRSDTGAFTVNTAPEFLDAELNWTGIGGASESKVLDYSIGDVDGQQVSGRNSPPTGSVELFTNSTYRISDLPEVFDYTASVSDFRSAQGTRDTNFTLSETGFRGSDFDHSLDKQRINNSVEAENRGENLSVNIEVDEDGTVVTSNSLSENLSKGESVNLTPVYESDYITGEKLVEEELGQNRSKTSDVDTQYLFNQTGLEAVNNRDFGFDDVDISSKCSIDQSSSVPSGSGKVTSECGNESVSGDWIENEKNGSTQHVSGVPLFGSGLDERYTASQNVEVTNVRTDFNLSVDLSGMVGSQSYCSILNSTEKEIAKDSVESFSFSKSCSGGEEVSYTPVEKTESSDSFKYVYESVIRVFSNVTENQTIQHGIPEARLDNFASRVPGDTEISIDGNSNDLNITGTELVDSTEYVVVEVGDSHGNSSLHKGQHNISLTYYEEKDGTASSPSGGTGGGSLTVIDENEGPEYSWRLSGVTSESAQSFQINGYPGDTFSNSILVENTGENNVTLDIECVSSDGSCDYVDTSVDRVILNTGDFSEKQFEVSGRLPQSFSEEDAPLNFDIRVNDRSWNGTSADEDSVSRVGFTVNYSPFWGFILDLALDKPAQALDKLTEWRSLETPFEWGNDLPYPFVVLPLLAGMLFWGIFSLLQYLFGENRYPKIKWGLTLTAFILVFIVG